MYIPEAFEETRPEVLCSLIRQYPLAIFVANTSEGLEANHFPLLFVERDGKSFLQGHVAKANAIWRAVPEGSNVLAVFQGPQHYVSPNWYPSKAEHGRVVPTWNYATVHARGTVSWKRNADWMLGFLKVLTNAMESSQERPWSVTDAPESYVEQLLNAIVGLEIEVTEMVGKWKVSQNRETQDRQGVTSALEKIPDSQAAAMADLVRKYMA